MIGCIDIGHTGISPGLDPGAVGSTGLKEADVVLKVGNFLREYLLNKFGVKTFLTRESDDGSIDELWTRVAMAEENGADFLISLHCNAHDNPAANGFEIWTWIGQDESDELAEYIFYALEVSFPNLNGRSDTSDGDSDKEAKFGVLRGEMPSVLVEMAFITNPQEEELLASEDGQRKFAEAIGNGIMSWIG